MTNHLLTPTQKKALKIKAHHLKPIIIIGSKGLTDAVIAETDTALLAHELIKVKINGHEREERAEIFAVLSESLRASPVQILGNTLILYRKKPDPK